MSSLVAYAFSLRPFLCEFTHVTRHTYNYRMKMHEMNCSGGGGRKFVTRTLPRGALFEFYYSWRCRGTLTEFSRPLSRGPLALPRLLTASCFIVSHRSPDPTQPFKSSVAPARRDPPPFTMLLRRFWLPGISITQICRWIFFAMWVLAKLRRLNGSLNENKLVVQCLIVQNFTVHSFFYCRFRFVEKF